MSDVRRTREGPRVRLNDAEVRLLTQLTKEIDVLLTGGAAPTGEPAATSDPLVEMTGMSWPDGDSLDQRVLAPSDPALARLLPDAYRDDDEAASDFRRYTETSLRADKRADATVVRQGLASIAINGQRTLDDAQTQAWLRFLTDARLVLASRLGIAKAGDDERFEQMDGDEPALMLYAAYSWLGGLLDEVLAAIGAG